MAESQGEVEFLYSEEQRLALEKLLEEGEHCFHNFITTNRVQPFLSDLELAQLTSSVEPYCPASPDDVTGFNGDTDGTHLSLQYWPERSDCSLPQLDLGWPPRAFYRGVTRVSVHPQPPLPGHSHIKEIVRKMIAQARKVIAVVMDLLTDVDIFKDLLDASFKRKVAVYIILEATGVPHFLNMCEKAAMHTGHLKNLRVRSIGGTGFFTRLSKKVCGSQSQKFMFVDGDKAVTGSYSFTWSASRLDRSISTVLTGQVVELFDLLFQDLYAMSNVVNLNKIKLKNEPKQEPLNQISKPSPTMPSDIIALKLNNPKYALVCGNVTVRSNHLPSEKCTAKTDCTEQVKEVSEIPHAHPGLLHLDKANMIDYLPVWPKPDSPSDVIGLINIREYKEPLQAHLMRSELSEVSQAIRYKNPNLIELPEKSLSERSHPRSRLKSSSLSADSANEQPLIQPLVGLEKNDMSCEPSKETPLPPSSPKEEAVLLLSIANPKTPQNSNKDVNNSPVNHGTEGLIDLLTEQRKSPDKNTSIEQGEENRQDNHGTSCCSVKTNSVTTHTLFAHFKTTSLNQSFERTSETMCNKFLQDDQWQISKDLQHDKNETNTVDCYQAETFCSYSISSDGYFDFIDSFMADSGCDGMVTRIPHGFKLFEMDSPPNTAAHSLTSLMSEFQEIEAGSCEHTPSYQSITVPQLQTRSLGQSNMQYAYLVNEAESLSETVSTEDIEEILEMYVPLQQGTEAKALSNPLKVVTDVQEAHDITAEQLNKKYELKLDSMINNLDLHSIDICGTNNSQISAKHLLLLQSKAAPPVPILKVAEAQCIVFSDGVNGVPFWKLNPDPYSSFN